MASMVDILKDKFSWNKFDEWRIGYPRLEDDENDNSCYSFSFYLFGKKFVLLYIVFLYGSSLNRGWIMVQNSVIRNRTGGRLK